MKKMKMESVNIAEQNIKKIADLFPNCITECAGEDGQLKKSVNFDLLRQMLSNDVFETDEKYEFTWVGKRASIVEVNKPIRKTLRPCPDLSVDWESTENLYIEGDNLEVLKLLQESYLSSIKMIYIDPPYNTGNDFIYHDNYAMDDDEYALASGEVDDIGIKYYKNTDANGKFHSDWCSMLYPRLMLARNLLSDDGVLFVSIDDNELVNLQNMCNEVFGSSNYIAKLVVKNNSAKNQSKYIGVTTEYCVIYAKNYSYMKSNVSEWRIKKKGASDINRYFKKRYSEGANLNEIRDEILELYSRPKYTHLSRWNKVDEFGVFADDNLSRSNGPKDFTIVNPNTGKACPVPKRGWGKSKEELLRLQKENRIWYGDGSTPPRLKTYLTDDSLSVPDNFFFVDTSSDKKMLDEVIGREVFPFPKSTAFIQSLVELCTSDNDIIMDFFSGSGTTADAILRANAEDGCQRRFILVQLPEIIEKNSEAFKIGYRTICDIGIKRIEICGSRIKNEQRQSIDTGFRTFKLDDSNMNDVYYAANDYTQDMLSMLESNVKADRTDLDLLFGCLLDWGLPLSMPYKSELIDGYTVHTYNEGDLIACFDENIPGAIIREIAKRQPLRAVFRDDSFNGSPEKINVGEIFKMLAPDTRVKVI